MPRLEPLLLLGFGDVEIVFAQVQTVAHQQVLERHDDVEEILRLLLGAEAHDALDAGAVVPGAVEDDELAARRQIGHEALEIPFGEVAVGRFARRVDDGLARAHVLDQTLDRAVLAGAVAAFEDDEHARAVFDQLALQLHQLDLQLAQGAAVVRVQAVFFVVVHGILRAPSCFVLRQAQDDEAQHDGNL